MVYYLIGMMGSGKTTIGNMLALKLEYNFIDTDDLIVKKYQSSIEKIINDWGIDFFRELENQVLQILQGFNDIVIATGGGIILKDDNIALMKKHGKIIYLETNVDIIEKRLDNIEIAKRPLLRKNTLKDIFQERKKLYEEACDIIVHCDNLNVEEICDTIIKKIKMID